MNCYAGHSIVYPIFLMLLIISIYKKSCINIPESYFLASDTRFQLCVCPMLINFVSTKESMTPSMQLSQHSDHVSGYKMLFRKHITNCTKSLQMSMLLEPTEYHESTTIYVLNVLLWVTVQNVTTKCISYLKSSIVQVLKCIYSIS